MSEPLKVVDMHTGGEPVRIVTAGYPPLPAGTILHKRAYVRDNLDHLRRILMFEPRGHIDMYGALLVEPDLPGADLAVLFMHNEGYSTMCGHAVIALGRYAVDEGLVPGDGPVATVNIECPCGMVEAAVEIVDGRAGAVSFRSVPSFAFAAGRSVDLPVVGPVGFDIAYGGAFYALAEADRFDLAFGRDPVRAFVDAASALTAAVKQAHPLAHPDHDDLAFLYGSILTDGGDGAGAATKNICVFADAQVDRSPTGSGVTARMAAMHAAGTVDLGETRRFESITGAVFTARIEREAEIGDRRGVEVRVSGHAYYCGRAEFAVEPDDPLGGGFLVR